MKSESYSDSEGESNLVIVTSSQAISSIKQETHNDYQNNLYPDDVIEGLWNAKAMGRYGPEEILVSLWYFVSHYFGISSRTDHAKLYLGNVAIETENGIKQMVFKKNFCSSGKDVSVFTTRFPPRCIPEIIDNKDRCPVAIFEEYLTRRPTNFSYPTSPFYLQPDKLVFHDNDGPWYAPAGLGKNRIGALFNLALSRCGQPTVRHYNSRRQIIGDANKSQSVISQKSVDNSPKIKLKICHLSSGNPIVTQTLSEESDIEPIKQKLRSITQKTSGMRKRTADESVEVKSEPLIDTTQFNDDHEQCEDDTKTYTVNTSMTKYVVKPTKRMWSLQKSIANIASKESNPIIRQIMLHLCMNRDIVLPSDLKASSGASTKGRLLRRSVKLSHLQLPLWPSIDKFCNTDLQRSMKYTFDDDNNTVRRDETE